MEKCDKIFKVKIHTCVDSQECCRMVFLGDEAHGGIKNKEAEKCQ